VRKHLSLILIGLLAFLTSGGQAHARAFKEQVPPVEKIKAKIAKLGTGEKAKAQVKLRSGEKIKGYVSRAGENDFTITEKKTGQTKTVAYADVVEVRKPGLSKGTKIALVVGIGVVATAAILAIAVTHSLGNFNLNGIAIR
jgi:hypothetical protein